MTQTPTNMTSYEESGPAPDLPMGPAVGKGQVAEFRETFPPRPLG
jgi:hypothetical protein